MQHTCAQQSPRYCQDHPGDCMTHESCRTTNTLAFTDACRPDGNDGAEMCGTAMRRGAACTPCCKAVSRGSGRLCRPLGLCRAIKAADGLMRQPGSVHALVQKLHIITLKCPVGNPSQDIHTRSSWNSHLRLTCLPQSSMPASRLP